MLNGEPWENPHDEVRTTKGKDLENMTPVDLENHLKIFDNLLCDFLAVQGGTNGITSGATNDVNRSGNDFSHTP